MAVKNCVISGKKIEVMSWRGGYFGGCGWRFLRKSTQVSRKNSLSALDFLTFQNQLSWEDIG
jgi:hypothetical protein